MTYSINVNKIYTSRLMMGMSQIELAEKSGVSFLSIYNLEAGKIKKPQIKTVKKICDALNVQIDEVVKFNSK